MTPSRAEPPKSVPVLQNTPKQRMLNAYRGVPSDRTPVAPEFWIYYPARVLGVDLIEFRKTPFHVALKTCFKKFGCEGWGTAHAAIPNPSVERRVTEKWVSDGVLETHVRTRTPAGELHETLRSSREEPAWIVERPIKDMPADLRAYELATLPDPEAMDVTPLMKAREEVGESFLLEAALGLPFFDYYASARQGGFEQAIMDLTEHEAELLALRERYVAFLTRRAEIICERTPFESLYLGCSWSCNSLLGPRLWRRWDKPVIQALADAVHRKGRLLHIHFHGRCMETVADFAELGIDCVCPFERPPGGDVEGLEGLKKVAQLLHGRTTMNGNVHTVETLIRGTPQDVRREVREIRAAFAGSSRVIIGTGDQVGRETPEENLFAMCEAAKEPM